MEAKKYTVKELLGCQEAMDNLLQERMLAVRDDLMFMMNQQNGRLARQLEEQNRQQSNTIITMAQNLTAQHNDTLQILQDIQDAHRNTWQSRWFSKFMSFVYRIHNRMHVLTRGIG